MDYQKLLEANQFIKAESLKVSISKQRFVSLISKEGVHRDAHAFQLLRKEVIKEQSFYIIDRKYDSVLGLQFDVEEKTDADNIF
jgi:CRISPR-associated endonuclease/helicase Cas3